MQKKITIVTLFLLVGYASPKIYAQMFGQNDVQYTQFDWHYIQSKHFDIYHYEGGLAAAEFVAAVAETALVNISRRWDYRLRKRLIFVVYNSHNDFEQTNLNHPPPSESVGGFTEFYKNRIVIPYEGSYEQLRHVTHHELTHAVMLQMLFGTGTFSIVTGMMRTNIPLWFVEGLAEYESRGGWDVESDMFMRDAVVNNYLPPIRYLYGFMAYKGGQSVLYYIAETYGEEKVSELIANVRFYKDIDTAIYKSLGMSISELSEKWRKALRKKYWPTVAEREEPSARAHQLTSHKYYRNFVNNSGELSPQGDRLAFLSDKSGYFDIYLISTLTGKRIRKLVSGQKSGRLEELHWLRPGIAWRPDGKQLVFAAKDRAKDALNFVDIETAQIIHSKKFDLDGIFSPDWSPDGAEIAFMGIRNSQSDIYTYNTKADSLRRITNDIFSDMQPCWSPDGKSIAFISDRSIHTDIAALPKEFAIHNSEYQHFDIYLINTNSGDISRVTNTDADEKSPVWSPDGSKIAFVSDLNGISNIYLKSMSEFKQVIFASTDKAKQQDIPTTNSNFYPITNVITGVDHLSWENQKLAFTSFYHGGYDIFLMTTPDDSASCLNMLANTAFINELPNQIKVDKTLLAEQETDKSENDLNNFVFGEKFRAGESAGELMNSNEIFLKKSDYLNTETGYKIHKYKTKFSADIITANAGYDPFFGFQGASLVSFSDLMGNHRVNFMTDVFVDIKNSDFALSYFYLPCQTDFGVGIFQKSQLFFSDGRFLIRDRNTGLNLQMTRPYDKYRRISYGLNLTHISRTQIADLKDENAKLHANSVTVSLFNLSYVKDNVLWESTGPIAGSRYNFSVQASPGSGLSNLDFRIYQLDYRTYYNFAYNYSAAWRFSTGFSEGRHKQQFFLGGAPNWINLKYSKNVSLDLEELYFSNFVSPVRGHDYYSQIGSKFFVTNFELRIPFINYLSTTWPVPLRFSNIRGNLFMDVGSAWDRRMEEILSSFGWGARVNLGLFILKYDMAWPTDFNKVRTPRHLLSLGADF